MLLWRWGITGVRTQSWCSSNSRRQTVSSLRSSWRCTPPGRPPRQRLVAAAAATRDQADNEPPADASAPPAGHRPPGRKPHKSSSSSSTSSRRPGTPPRPARSGSESNSSGDGTSRSRRQPGIPWRPATPGSDSDANFSDEGSTSRSRSSSNNSSRGAAAGGRSKGTDRSSGASPNTRRDQPPQQRSLQQQRPEQRGSRPSAHPGARRVPFTDRIREQTTLAGLQDLLQQDNNPGNAIHINAALQWLERHPREQPRSPALLAALVQQWVKGIAIENVSARICANVAYYCSKLGYVEDLGLYRALLQRFIVVREEANPQEVSNLLYALGSQEQLRGLLEPPVLLQLLQQLQQMGDGVNSQNVANALWAAAKLKPGDSPQLGRVVAQLLGRFLSTLGSAKPQEVSNTLYALALLPRAWPMDSARQLVEQLVALLPQARPQALSNVLWALGRYVERGWLAPLSEQPRARLQAAVSRLTTAVAAGGQAVKPQEVSNSLWGVAVLQAQVNWRVVGQLLGQVTQQQPNSQELANACWAVAKLQQLQGAPSGQQQPWQPAFVTAVQAFVPLLPKATAQDVSNMLWACGEVRHYPPQLLQDLTAASAPLSQLQQATPQAVANLCWALALLAPAPPPAALMASLLQRMQDLVAQQPSAVSSQNLANTAWAVAVLDQQQLARQLEHLAAAAFSQQQWASSQPEHLVQWHQVHLWLTDTQVLGPAGLGSFSGVSQQQLGQCREAWERQLASDAKASQVQGGVAKVLSTMPGVEVMGSEQRDQHDGSRSIDIVARYQGQLLAVEVDGPHHFTWPGQRPTGLTLARNRALQRRGYRVVTVPVNPGWQQLTGEQQQQQYLRGLLTAATGPCGSGRA